MGLSTSLVFQRRKVKLSYSEPEGVFPLDGKPRLYLCHAHTDGRLLLLRSILMTVSDRQTGEVDEAGSLQFSSVQSSPLTDWVVDGT